MKKIVLQILFISFASFLFAQEKSQEIEYTTELGISGKQPIIDEMAPLYHVRADAPPMLIITGDRELEMLGRYEENAYMMRMMKVAGHKNVRINELDGNNHGQMMYPALPLLAREVKYLTFIVKQE